MQFVLETLKESGFSVVEAKELPEKGRGYFCKSETSDLESALFVNAIKL